MARYAQIDRVTGAVQLTDYPLAADHPALHPEKGHLEQRLVASELEPEQAVRFDASTETFEPAAPPPRDVVSVGALRKVAEATKEHAELAAALEELLEQARRLGVIDAGSERG